MLKNIKIRHINIIAFIILAYLFLPVWNDDLLYTWQEYSVFISGKTFMTEMLREHGLFAWVGCYLTQFFYYPWLGSSMLIAIWVASYYCIADAFKLKDEFSTIALIPVVCLLMSVIEVGYWIYYLDSPGYCFSNSIILLVASLVTWGVSKIVKPILGLCLKGKALDIAAPIILIMCVEAMLSLLGFRRESFKHGSYESMSMALPFIAVRASFILLAVPYHAFVGNDKRTLSIVTGVMGGLFATLGALTNIVNVSDNNFHSELRMYRALDEMRYEDVISEAGQNKQEPTSLMVLYKNIALMHTGQMTEMFKTNSCGTMPNVDKDFHVRTASISGEMVYYQFGQMNYAYRWAIENSVKHGMTNARLKMLARCAIFNQEFDVARKYLTMLKATTFYRKWAQERERWTVYAADFFNSKEYQSIEPLLNEDINDLDNDNGSCEKWVLEHFADLIRPTSDMVEELIMCTSLWVEDEYSFLIHFYDYYQKHNNQPTPQLYQEALILLGGVDESPITIDNYPFDTNVKERFSSFINEYRSLSTQGLKPEQIAAKLKPLYGETYWWYYYFYTDFNIY